jgi:carbon-monoxide dehydrogenase large subunit
VEYEALPVVVDPFKSMLPDATVLREDLKGKMTGAHGPRKHHNHIFEWAIGDKDRPTRFSQGRCDDQGMISYHRTHPSPLETCQCGRFIRQDQGRIDTLGHLPGAACHPHRRR